MEKDVILYSQPTCYQCRMFHAMLDKKGIKYKEIQDIDYMKSIGINHTPILEVEGVRLSGVDIKNYIMSGTLPEREVK